MLKQLFAITCLSLILLSSCQKEVKTPPAAPNSITQSLTGESDLATGRKVVDSTGHWFGGYAGYNGPYPIIPDSVLINNGVAKDPKINIPFEYSNVYYDIPEQYNITGDSITFEATAKNTTNTGQYGYDVVLQLFGDQHDAELHFVGVQAGLQYTQYFVGNAKHTGLQQLVHYFDHFETIRLIMKNNSTAVYLDTVELYKFKYGVENSIGRLKRVNVAFKGRGEVTQVNVRNSFGRKIIFKEEFDIDKQSHTVYYYQ